jgi:dynein heavy chain
MFVGNTGTGKTAIMMNKLRSMDPEAMAYTTINMNSFSDAPSLQVMMEQPLEKKSGVRYGPPGSRRWVEYWQDMMLRAFTCYAVVAQQSSCQVHRYHK